MLFLPVSLNKVAARRGLSGKNGDDFMCANTVVQRFDKRLDDGDSAVIGTRIAPRLEIVRFRHMPLTKFGSLVAVRSEENF